MLVGAAAALTCVVLSPEQLEDAPCRRMPPICSAARSHRRHAGRFNLYPPGGLPGVDRTGSGGVDPLGGEGARSSSTWRCPRSR